MASRRKTEKAEDATEPRGVVFTRPEVVEFILDLTGYTPRQPNREQARPRTLLRGRGFPSPNRQAPHEPV